MALAEPLPAIRAAVYCRISRDVAGDMLGVRRQERLARALCKRKGWAVEQVFTDDDISAWSGKRRPAYLEMLHAIASRRVNAVVAYDLDRLHRHPRELEEFFVVCDGAGLTSMATVTGDIDLATPEGRMVARIMGAFAKKSSDDTSRRLRDRFDEKAAAGLPHGARPFGYEPGGMVVRQSEARLIRQAARDVLAGESLNAIAARWNALGIDPPQRATRWNGTTVRSVLTNPRHAGLRVHRRAVLGPAAWPAVVGRATHERLVVLFDDPERKRKNPPRRQAFTGLIRCGRCGEPLNRGITRRWITYKCHRAAGRGGCGVLTITADPLESLVTEALFRAVDDKRTVAGLRERAGKADDRAAAHLSEVEGRLRDLARMFGEGHIDRAEWVAARKPLETRRDQARKALAADQRRFALEPYAKKGALRESWEGMSTDRKRAVLAAVFETIIIHPATTRGPKFDTNRVELVWR